MRTVPVSTLWQDKCKAWELWARGPIIEAGMHFLPAVGAPRMQSTKILADGYSCAHRVWQSESHCSLIHGYDRAFEVAFGGTLDRCGFVMDFGGLKPVRQHLCENYDHTLLLSADDPMIVGEESALQNGSQEWPIASSFGALNGYANVVVLPYGPSIEGSARYMGEWVDGYVWEATKGRVWVDWMRVYERMPQNSAIWNNPIAGWTGA